ncbi:MAG: trehalase family glycosidase [Sphingomonadales bacterium]
MSASNDPSALNAQAIAILKGNDRGGYTVPNGRVYPFQWNWDSAFVALGFARFDIDRAWREIETLFQAQWDDGFLPHIVFWQDDPGYFPGPDVWGVKRAPRTSGITQPPVAATMVRSLWEQDPSNQARARLQALFPKLLAWHEWFHRCRDVQGNALVVTVHPWETGRDNSPEWDAPASAVDISDVGPYQRRDTSHLDQSMRPTKLDYDRYVAMVQYGKAQDWDQALIARKGPFRVADAGLSLILLRANRDLAALAAVLGRDSDAERIGTWISRAEEGVDYLWNDDIGAFCSRDIITGRSSAMVTSASFLGFYAGVATGARGDALCGHLQRMAGKLRYLVPSLDPDHPQFDPIRYWRGPVWAVVNYMIARGLADSGQDDWAARVRGDTRALIQETGFYEAFCPLTGRGTGGDDFSWTAAIWLALAGADG